MTNEELRLLLQHVEDHHAGERAHGERVAVYAVATAAEMGWTDGDLRTMRCAAALHDIGKLDLPVDLLRKSGRLEGEEVLALRKHVDHVSDHVAEPEIVQWITSHHERWDGAGYPQGLRETDIPEGSRIIAVAETFDVLLNDRRWREPLSDEAALDEVRRCAGTQFDPRVVEAFLAVQPLIQPVEIPSHA